MCDQALERAAPPDFPLDASLLPECRARVRLAVRLDAQLRAASKNGADAAWLRRNAEAAGIQLSDDEDADEDARPRAGRAATGDGSSAAEIQQVCSCTKPHVPPVCWTAVGSLRPLVWAAALLYGRNVFVGQERL